MPKSYEVRLSAPGTYPDPPSIETTQLLGELGSAELSGGSPTGATDAHIAEQLTSVVVPGFGLDNKPIAPRNSVLTPPQIAAVLMTGAIPPHLR